MVSERRDPIGKGRKPVSCPTYGNCWAVGFRRARPRNRTLRRIWLDELGIRLGPMESLCVIKHSHTSFRVKLYAFWCDGYNPASGLADKSAQLRWATTNQLEKLGFSSAHRKIIELPLKGSAVGIEQALLLEHMTLLWVRTVRAAAARPHGMGHVNKVRVRKR